MLPLASYSTRGSSRRAEAPPLEAFTWLCLVWECLGSWDIDYGLRFGPFDLTATAGCVPGSSICCGGAPRRLKSFAASIVQCQWHHAPLVKLAPEARCSSKDSNFQPEDLETPKPSQTPLLPDDAFISGCPWALKKARAWKPSAGVSAQYD